MWRICRIAALGGLALSLAGCEVQLSMVVAGTTEGTPLPRTRIVARGAILPHGPQGEPWRPTVLAREGLAGLYRWETWWEVGRGGR